MKSKHAKLKTKAWDLLSLCIRLERSDCNGMVKCVTCQKVLYWKGQGMQAGHAIKGRGNYILFNELYIHPQCKTCNIFNGGEYTRFAIYLLEKRIVTRKKLKEDEIKSRLPYPLKDYMLEEKIKEYKERLAKELKKRGF